MNLPDASTLGTLGVGAVIAAIVAGWQQVKGFLQGLAGVLVMTSSFRYYGSEAAQAYCVKKLSPTPSSFRLYDGLIRFVRPQDKHGVVFWEIMGSSGRLFWKGLVPVWVSVGNKVGEANSTTFRYIRGTINHDSLAVEIADCLNVKVDGEGANRFRVVRLAGKSSKRQFDMPNSSGENNQTTSSPTPKTMSYEESGRLVGWSKDDIGEQGAQTNPLERLALTEEVEEAVGEIQRWADSKQWYAERQIPWRRGVLLHGPPGTGKSSLVKALAQKMDVPIYLLDISTMDNEEFHDSYQNALRNTPAVVLIEDIDAVFDGRENIAAEKGKGLTFDCLLNTISGVEATDGVLLVVTTNHIDKVDDALGVPQAGSTSTRPGRIDRAVEMSTLDSVGRRKLARRILSGCDESWVERLVEQGNNDTGAQFEDRCATAALNIFWSSNPRQTASESSAAEEAAA